MTLTIATMTQDKPRSVERIGPSWGIAAVCLWLAFAAIRNTLILRVFLAWRSETFAYGVSSRDGWMTVVMAERVLGMILPFVGIVLLLKFLRQSSIWFCVAVLWLCDPLLGLARSLLTTWMIYGRLPYVMPQFMAWPQMINIIITGYLLLSERVELVYQINTRVPLEQGVPKLWRWLRGRG
jgi:hypothetical protein